MRKIYIELNNVYSEIKSDLPSEVLENIKSVCSYESKYYDSKAGYQKTTQLSIFNEHNLTFPSGLVHRVSSCIKDSGYKCKIKDLRERPKIDIDLIMKRFEDFGKPLRDYQIEGGLVGIQELSGLYNWSTGSGKTVLFNFLLMTFDDVSLILVNRKELMEQIATEVSAMTGRTVGIIGDGKWQPSKWTVAIVNSLREGLESKSPSVKIKTETFLSKIKIFIGDEIHHLGAMSWKNIARACSNACVRFGFSGTCFHPESEDLYLVAYNGEIISDIAASKLIKEGWLAQPYIYLPDIDYESDYKYMKDWHKIKKHLIRENDKVNESGVKFLNKIYNKGLTAIYFAGNDVVYGKKIYDMCLDVGIHHNDIRYMTGRENSLVRKKVLDDFREKRFQILGGTSIYDEGVDVPHVGAGANFGQGYSEISTRQRIGRVLRKTRPEGLLDVDPKEFQKKYYWDPMNVANEITGKHSNFRKSIYESESGFKVFEREFKG